MLVENLIERQKELDSKREYLPNAAESEYISHLKSLWQNDYLSFRKQYRYFNDKDLIAYMDMNERDSFLYVGPKKLDNWRSRTRRQTPREKFNAIVAAIIDQNLVPEVFAHDVYGRDLREAAEVQQLLLAYSDDVENADEKRKLRAFELLKHGTIANEINWLHVKRLEKKITSEFNPKTGEIGYETKEVTDFEGIWSKIVPINRVILGDPAKHFIEEQPNLWKEYVLTYDEARNMFYNWKNWAYVKPSSPQYDNWNDTEMQLNVEEENVGLKNYVRMRVYENRWTNESAILLNEVLMTPIGFPLPRKDGLYSITWTQIDEFSSNFAYGRSFFHSIHNDSVTLDFLYNALIDKARQGLEPPLVTGFKNLINKNMFAPGKVSQGDINLKPLVNHQGVTNADIEITRFVEENINKSSVAPIFSGQSQTGGQTAYEIREQQKAALRVLGLTLYAIARMEADIACLKSSLIWEHYPKMKNEILDSKTRQVTEKVRQFVVRGEQVSASGFGRKEILFDKMPEGKKEVFAKRLSLMKEEDKEIKRGESMKKYVVDPEVLKNVKYCFKLVANPAQRKSKLADAIEAREKYAAYILNPLIDQEWATKMLLRSYGDDEDKAIKKQEPQVPSPTPVGAPAPQMGAEQASGQFGATEGQMNAKKQAMMT